MALAPGRINPINLLFFNSACLRICTYVKQRIHLSQAGNGVLQLSLGTSKVDVERVGIFSAAGNWCVVYSGEGRESCDPGVCTFKSDFYQKTQ